MMLLYQKSLNGFSSILHTGPLSSSLSSGSNRSFSRNDAFTAERMRCIPIRLPLLFSITIRQQLIKVATFKRPTFQSEILFYVTATSSLWTAQNVAVLSSEVSYHSEVSLGGIVSLMRCRCLMDTCLMPLVLTPWLPWCPYAICLARNITNICVILRTIDRWWQTKENQQRYQPEGTR